MVRAFAAVVVAVLLLTAENAVAQSTLKRKIIDSCDDASLEFRALPAESRRELIPYLRRVLTLKLTELDAGDHRPPLRIGDTAGSPPAARDPWAGDYWRSMQPERELRAKECAVLFLEELEPESAEAIPELIALALDPSIPSALRERSERLVRKVAVTAGKAPFEPSSELVFQLLRLLDGESAFLAQSTLLEFHSQAVPALLEALTRPDATLHSRAQDLLVAVGSERSVPALVPLLNSSDEALRVRAAVVLGAIGAAASESIAPLIERLEDPSPEVQASALGAINRLLQAPIQLTEISASSADRLLGCLRRTPRDSLLVQALTALLPRIPRGEEELMRLYAEGESDLRTSIINILGSRPTHRSDLFALLVKALKEPALAVKISAVRALREQQTKLHEVLRAYTELLRTNAAQKDLNERHLVLLEVANAVAFVKPGKLGAPLALFFVHGLGLQERVEIGAEQLAPRPFAEALIAIGPAAAPEVRRVLTHPNPLVRARAANILGQILPSEKASIDALARLLADRDPRVREEAKLALTAIGKPALATVRKLLGAPDLEIRLAASETVRVLDRDDTAALRVIVEAVRRSPCAAKLTLVARSAPFPQRELDEVTSVVIACLEQRQPASEDLKKALLALAPLAPQSATRVLDLIAKHSLERTMELWLLERSRTLGLPSEAVAAQLLALLKNGEGAVRFKTLSLLGELGPAASPALPALHEIAISPKTELLLRGEAAVAMARIDSAAFDYTSFFLQEFAPEHGEWARKAALKLGPALALPLCQKALAAQPPANAVWAAAALGDMGAQAKPALPELLAHLDSPALASEAALALVKIDPTHPSALPALRRLLNSASSRTLRSSDFAAAARPLLQQIADAPESRYEGQVALRLLSSDRP